MHSYASVVESTPQAATAVAHTGVQTLPCLTNLEFQRQSTYLNGLLLFVLDGAAGKLKLGAEPPKLKPDDATAPVPNVNPPVPALPLAKFDTFYNITKYSLSTNSTEYAMNPF